MQRLRDVTGRLTRPVREHGAKVLRLAAFVAVLGLGVGLLVAHQARAQLGEMMLGLGAEMIRYHDAERQDAPRELRLNGETIHLSSGTTEHDLQTVLDFYDARCQKRDGQLGERALAVADDAALENVDEVKSSLLDAVLREQQRDRGFVACLDLGEERLEQSELEKRAERFRKSLDLSDLGHMRYVYAEQGGGTTHFVAFWTEGSFDIGEMFPKTGDAPGRDPKGVPRPPSSRRLLSAWEQGLPQSMTVYVSERKDAGALERFYRERMPRKDWVLLENEHTRARAGGPPTLVFERHERMITLVFGTDEQQRGTTTVLVSR